MIHMPIFRERLGLPEVLPEEGLSRRDSEGTSDSFPEKPPAAPLVLGLRLPARPFQRMPWKDLDAETPSHSMISVHQSA